MNAHPSPQWCQTGCWDRDGFFLGALWRRSRPSERGLWLERCDNGTLKVIDECRPHRPRELTLHGWQAKLYLACDNVRKLPGLLREQELAYVSSRAGQTFIGECTERQLIAWVGDELVAIAVTRPPRTIRHATDYDDAALDIRIVSGPAPRQDQGLIPAVKFASVGVGRAFAFFAEKAASSRRREV